MAALLPNLGGLRLGPAAGGGGFDAEPTAGLIDDYELNPNGDAYSREWDRAALHRVADPSAQHEHWYEGHRGPKFGVTVATARYFRAHKHSYESIAKRTIGAELIVHGWHLTAGPEFSSTQANPALEWLMDMRVVPQDAAAADARGSARPDYYASYANDSVHRTPGCDLGGECVVPNYEHLDHRTHSALVDRLNPDDPKDIQVKSMLVGSQAPVGYIMQLWVPEEVVRRRQMSPEADPDPLRFFEPFLYEAVHEILTNMRVPKSDPGAPNADARGLFNDWDPPASTVERTARYLHEKLGPNGFRARRFGLVTGPVKGKRRTINSVQGERADLPNVPRFDFMMDEGWLPLKFYDPDGRAYLNNAESIGQISF